MRYVVESQLWRWEVRTDSWTFATVPAEESAEIRELVGDLARGFGSVPVTVRLGATTWRTSIFPSKESGTYALPIKKAVQKAEGVAVGDTVTLDLELRI
ncbi:MAG: DUF1905 domain-containing protein [Actinomycetales bacterium]|nr:DUF1905 domain-containing protein [Actinomycetales bacterium]